MVRTLCAGKPREGSREEAGAEGGVLLSAANGSLEQEAGPQEKSTPSTLSGLRIRQCPPGQLREPQYRQDPRGAQPSAQLRRPSFNSLLSNRKPSDHYQFNPTPQSPYLSERR